MRREASYVTTYGPKIGSLLYRALQSQAAHAGVSSRRNVKIQALEAQVAALIAENNRQEAELNRLLAQENRRLNGQ